MKSQGFINLFKNRFVKRRLLISEKFHFAIQWKYVHGDGGKPALKFVSDVDQNGVGYTV